MGIFGKTAKTIFFAAAMAAAVSTSALAQTPDKVVPMGDVVGIDLKVKGIIVEDISEFEDENGSKSSPAKDAGFKAGDIITHINETEIKSPDDIKGELEKCEGDPLTVRIERNGQQTQLTITPRVGENGQYELGLWLRDGLMGLGTVTYYDRDSGMYGALGHPISDSVSESVLPVEDGEIFSTKVTDVVKGKSGTPGQLQGDIDIDSSIGTIEGNTKYGIYGKLEKDDIADSKSEMEIAGEKEIEIGKAYIISAVSGETKQYEVEITRVYSGRTGKTMMFTVTDDELIGQTGGIVQGMSGSPIIQNGKLIGAVTHVLVNDPKKGYGIGIETMLKAAEQAA